VPLSSHALGVGGQVEAHREGVQARNRLGSTRYSSMFGSPRRRIPTPARGTEVAAPRSSWTSWNGRGQDDGHDLGASVGRIARRRRGGSGWLRGQAPPWARRPTGCTRGPPTAHGDPCAGIRPRVVLPKRPGPQKRGHAVDLDGGRVQGRSAPREAQRRGTPTAAPPDAPRPRQGTVMRGGRAPPNPPMSSIHTP
jgi:hypothetical protein